MDNGSTQHPVQRPAHDRRYSWVENGGDAVLATLIACGGSMGFGVPGESYLALLNAFTKTPDFRFYQTRHEAGAANMAEAYGKMTGKPGLAFVTRGPGATHASIGLHTAYQDSTPMILLIGQVARDQRDREAFQEMDYKSFFADCTKWAVSVDDPRRLTEYVARAYHCATSGRPGPVALALPEDVLSAPLPDGHDGFALGHATETASGLKKGLAHPVTPALDPDSLAPMKALIERAERPVLMVGGSGWTAKATAALDAFAKASGIPVVASFRAQDRMDNRHSHYCGEIGISPSPITKHVFEEADLILALGPRLGEMTTGGYSRLRVPRPLQNLIHIHQSADELNTVYHADLSLAATPGQALAALIGCDLMPRAGWDSWRARLRGAYQSWHDTRSETATSRADLSLAAVYETLKASLPETAIITNGAGNYAAWLHRYMPYRSFPSQLAPTSGAMGYGVPAAIAAKLMSPDREVVCFAGDGCFMMSVQELATAAQHGAAVLFLVFNNGGFGTIKTHQENHYPGRASGTDLQNPDFKALAESFGLKAWRVEKSEDFAPKLAKALEATAMGVPALIDLLVDPEALTPTKRLR